MDMPLTEASILRISSSRWASSDCSNLVYAIFVSIELKGIDFLLMPASSFFCCKVTNKRAKSQIYLSFFEREDTGFAA